MSEYSESDDKAPAKPLQGPLRDETAPQLDYLNVMRPSKTRSLFQLLMNDILPS